MARLLGYQALFVCLALTAAGQSQEATVPVKDSVSVLPAGALIQLGSHITHGNRGGALAISPDGVLLATGGEDIFMRGDDISIQLWDVASGRPLRRMTGNTSGVTNMVFSADGKRLVSTARDGSLHIWDVTTGKSLHQLQDQQGGAAALAFSADGQVLATGYFDKSIRLWDVAAGKELRQLQGHRSSIASLAFTPDNRTLVSGSADGS